MDITVDPTYSVAGLITSIIEEVGAKERRQHELRMKELDIIDNSDLRNQYVQQLMLNRVLAPIEEAQHEIHNSAKHAQWLSEVIVYYHGDHRMDVKKAHELSRELKLLAIQITNADTLYDLKLVYQVATLFNDKVFVFRHADPDYSIHKEIRKGVLNRLNTCIANTKNFQIRIEAVRQFSVQQEQLLLGDKSSSALVS